MSTHKGIGCTSQVEYSISSMFSIIPLLFKCGKICDFDKYPSVFISSDPDFFKNYCYIETCSEIRTK